MPVFKQRIERQLLQRHMNGLARTVQPKCEGNSPWLIVNRQKLSNFSGNDYLGLAQDKELIEAWQQNLTKYGAGSGASPLVVGQSYAHQALQDALCDWLGYPQAVLFNSGFSANQAVLFTVLQESDTLIQDKLNHASLMEAGMLGRATMKRFRHNDPQHLIHHLTRSQEALVVTEGVFSMDGDQAPLAEVASCCRDHDAWLMVDDAHGIGVLGDEGRGSCHLSGVRPQILMVTFGKALGMAGAAVMCDKSTADYLVQFARHYVYSTAMPPAQAATLSQAVAMVRRDQWRRDKLLELQSLYDTHMGAVEGYVHTPTPIKPFILGRSDRAVSVANQMQRRGQWVSAIRPPTVPAASARLRLTLTAAHTREQVDELTRQLIQVSQLTGVA